MKAYQQGQVRFVLWEDGGFTAFWDEVLLCIVYENNSEALNP